MIHDKFKQYARNLATKCPFCGSGDLDIDELTMIAFQPNECLSCGKEWNLTNIIEIEKE